MNESKGRGRPKQQLTRSQMLHVAQLFYESGLRRDQIAKQMHIENRKVTALLDAAREQKIVQFSFAPAIVTDLEEQIMQKFGPHLKKVIVVEKPPGAGIGDISRGWAIAAAKYFDELVKGRGRNQLHVAVTGGQFFLEFVSAIPVAPRPNVFVHVSALIGHGRLAELAGHFHSLAVASLLASRTGGIAGHLEFATVSPYNPAKPGKPGLRTARSELIKVRKNKTVRQVVEAMDKLDVVFGGIGIVNPQGEGVTQEVRNRFTMEPYLQYIITPQMLTDEGAVGDFSYCPFDEKGNTKPKRAWRFFLTAGEYSKHKDIDFFKHMASQPDKRVVGFGGMWQLPAILVALKARIVNVLITDEETARHIVQQR